MKESQKPNDILVATISAPNATLMDLIQNDINASNTQLLTMDEYKQSQYIQDKFTKDGTFDNNAFEQYYTLAAQKFEDLSDEDLATKLQKEIKWDPNSLYKPIDNSQDIKDLVTFTPIKNPHKQTLGLADFNKWSAAKYTAYEEAQMHKVWDSENKKWLDYTAEDMPFTEKLFGIPLRYAKYQEDVYDQNGILLHRKGEFKTDEEGAFYTETMPKGEQLMDSEIVKLADIATSEGSVWNSINVFEGDDREKSVAGTALKTVLMVAPYLTPWSGTIGAVTGLVGLASALPTIYKSLSSPFGGNDSALFRKSTDAENWLQKFGVDVSVSSRDSFWNFEQLMNMGSEVFGQLHQQRAAGRLAQYFKKVNKADQIENPAKYVRDLRKQSELGQKLSLGYMALTSAADVYNQSKNAGYSDEASGIVSLASMGALYGIMRFNESARGIGTWMLDKTTGYSQEVNSKGIFKAFKPMFDEINEAYQTAIGTSKKDKLILKLREFMQKAKYQSFGIWSGAIVEGTEEVTEEVIQDCVKAMADASVALGITKNEGKTFGGLSNVFSKEGLNRYLSTFVGGAIGGAIFDLQMNVLPGSDPNLRRVDANLTEQYLNGTLDLVEEEVKRYCKALDNGKSPIITKIGDQEIQLPTNGETVMQAVAQGVIQRIKTLRNAYDEAIKVAPESARGSREALVRYLVNDPGLGIKGSSEFSTYISDEYQEKMNAFAEAKMNLNSAINFNQKKNKTTETPTSQEEIDKLESEVKQRLEDVRKFFNGTNGFRFSTMYKMHKLAQSGDLVFKFYDEDDDESLIYAESPKQYAWFKYHLDFNELKSKDDPDYDKTKPSKEQVIEEHKDLVRGFKENRNKFTKYLETITDMYIDNQQRLSKHLGLMTGEELKQWLKDLDYIITEGDTEEEKAAKQKLNLLIANTSRDQRGGKSLMNYLDAISAELIKLNPKAYSNIQNLMYLAVSDRVIGKWNEEKQEWNTDEGVYTINGFIQLENYLKTLTDEKYKDKVAKVKQEINKAKRLINTFVDIAFSRLQIQGNWTEDLIKNTLLRLNEILNNSSDFSNTPIMNELNATIETINNLVDDIKGIQENKDTSIIDTDNHVKSLKLNLKGNANLESIISFLNTIRANATYAYLKGDDKRYTGRDIQAEVDLYRKNIIIPMLKDMLGQLTTNQNFKDSFIEDLSLFLANNFDEDTINNIADKQNLDLLNTLKQNINDDNTDLGDLIQRLYYEFLQNNEEFKLYVNLISQINAIEAPDSNRKIGENPIYGIITDWLTKFQTDNRSVTVFEYLFDKNLQINNLKVLDSFNLNVEELHTIIKDFDNAIRSLIGTLNGAVANYDNSLRIPFKIPSLNDDIKEYAKTFNLPETQLNPNNFVTIDVNVYNSIWQSVQELMGKLEFIDTLYQYKLSGKIGEDRALEKRVSKALLLNYSKLNLGENFKPNVEIDDYDDLVKEVIRVKTEIFNKVKEILNSQNDDNAKKAQLKEWFTTITGGHEDIDIVNGFIPFINLDKKGDGTDGINPYFALMDFVATISENNADLLAEYKEAIGATNEDNIIRRFDQYTTYSIIYSSLTDSQGYFKELDGFLAEKKKNTKGIKTSIESSMTFLSGSSGTGKSTTVSKAVVHTLQKKGYNIIATSISENKTKSFQEEVGTQNKGNYDAITGEGLKKILNDCDIKDNNELVDAVKDSINKLKEKLVESIEISKNEDINISIENGLTIQGKVSEDGVITITSIKPSEDNENNVFNALEKALESVSTDNKNVIIVDEATKLDPATLYVLNMIAEYTNNKVLLVGDEFQRGFEAKFKDGDNTYTINLNTDLFYCRRPPYMVQSIRGENTGVIANLNSIVRIMNSCVYGKSVISPIVDITISPENTSTVKDYFEASPLVFKYTKDGETNELMGHQITNTEDELNQVLSLIKDQLPEEETLKVVIGEDFKDQEENIKTKLEGIIGEGKVDIFIEGDPKKDIQGDESNYVLLYNLKYQGDINPDTNLRNLNTYASRAKKFTIIFDDGNDRLFSSLKITSVQDDTIGKDSFNQDDIKNINKLYYESVDPIIESYKTKSEKSETKSSTTSEDENTEDQTPEVNEEEAATKAEVSSEGIESDPEQPENKKSEPIKSSDPRSVVRGKNNMGVVDTYACYLGEEFNGLYDKEKGFNYGEALKIANGVDINKNYSDFLAYIKSCKEANQDFILEDENQLKTYINQYRNDIIIGLLNYTQDKNNTEECKYTLQKKEIIIYDKPVDYKFGKKISQLCLIAELNGVFYTLGAVRQYDSDGNLIGLGESDNNTIWEVTIDSFAESEKTYDEGENEKTVEQYNEGEKVIQITKYRTYSLKRKQIEKLGASRIDVKNGQECTIEDLISLGYKPVCDTKDNVIVHQFSKGKQGFDAFKEWYSSTYNKNLPDEFFDSFKNFYYAPTTWITVYPEGNEQEQIPLCIFKHPTDIKIEPKTINDSNSFSIIQFFNFIWNTFKQENDSSFLKDIEGDYYSINGKKRFIPNDKKELKSRIEYLKDQINSSKYENDFKNKLIQFVTHYQKIMIDADPKNNKGGRSNLASEANNLLNNKTLKDKALSYFRVREFHKDKSEIHGTKKPISSSNIKSYLTNYVPEPPRYLIKFVEEPQQLVEPVSGSEINSNDPSQGQKPMQRQNLVSYNKNTDTIKYKENEYSNDEDGANEFALDLKMGLIPEEDLEALQIELNSISSIDQDFREAINSFKKC